METNSRYGRYHFACRNGGNVPCRVCLLRSHSVCGADDDCTHTAVVSTINIIVLPISTAFAEDGLYLGCGVHQIKNKYTAVIVSALFFALQHSFIPTLFDMKYVLYRFLSFLPLTIILCWYYYKKRNPLPIMVGHAVIDMATVMQIFATSLIPGLYEKMCAM